MAAVRNPWVNRALLAFVFGLPILVFIGIQFASAYTRSGTIDEVWFANTADGPRIVGRDQIVSGTRNKPTLRNRLVVVDARDGERLAREHVQRPNRLLAVTTEGLWFCEQHGCADVHLRDPNTLARVNTAASPPAANPEPPKDPLVFAVEVGGQRLEAVRAEDGITAVGTLRAAAFLIDEVTNQPITLDGASAVVVHRPADDLNNTLLVSRVGLDLKPLWTAKLERQRAIRGAHLVGDALVLVTSGAARDFAISINVANGQRNWVHYF